MSVGDGGDAGGMQLYIVVDSDAERAVRTASATSADALFVAVENMRRKILLDCPFAESLLKVIQGWKELAFCYWRHR